MNFRVDWQDQTEIDLGNACLAAKDDGLADELTLASNTIDKLLAMDPYACSESRDAGSRIVIVQPLSAYFLVDDAARVVSVFQLRYWGRPRK